MEWSQPEVLVCTTKDGMITAWSAGMYDQRWSVWSAGMYDQRWNGLSLVICMTKDGMVSQPGAEKVVMVSLPKTKDLTLRLTT